MTAPVLPPFPTDPQTLDLLDAAVRPSEDAERSSLGDLCELMADLAGVPLVGDEGFRIAYHPNDVIGALVDEVRRLRGAQKGDAQ